MSFCHLDWEKVNSPHNVAFIEDSELNTCFINGPKKDSLEKHDTSETKGTQMNWVSVELPLNPRSTTLRVFSQKAEAIQLSLCLKHVLLRIQDNIIGKILLTISRQLKYVSENVQKAYIYKALNISEKFLDYLPLTPTKVELEFETWSVYSFLCCNNYNYIPPRRQAKYYVPESVLHLSSISPSDPLSHLFHPVLGPRRLSCIECFNGPPISFEVWR